MFELLILLFLIFINGFLALSEIAIVTSKRNKLQKLIEEGNTKAAYILELKEMPNQYLSTIQIGITLVNILAGVFSGTTIANALANLIKNIPYVSGYSYQISLFIVVLLLTYLTLLGELIPKRIGLHNAEKLAIKTINYSKWFFSFTKPLVAILSISIDFVLRIIGHRPDKEKIVSEDEVKFMLELGAKTGEFEIEEKNMIKRVFHLSEQSVSAIMTPRIDIDFLDIDETLEIQKAKLAQAYHSYLPVCKSDLDNLAGVVHVKDILSKILESSEINFNEIILQPHFISENTSVLILLETFKKDQVHIAVVIDEYGSTKGIATLNDILGSIVGNIPDEDDYEVDESKKLDENTWLLDGKLSVLELKELIQVDELPDEERGDYQTLAGFILYQLKRIPKINDSFEWKNYKFEVEQMDLRRIDRVKVSKLPHKTNKKQTN